MPAPTPDVRSAPARPRAGGGRAGTDGGTSALLLHLLHSGQARSRSDLIALTGASRSSVGLRVQQLVDAGLVREVGPGSSTGGRPPTLLVFNADAGCVLGIDLGVTSVEVALTDLEARPLALRAAPVRTADGPDVVLAQVLDLAEAALAEAGRAAHEVKAVAMGVPGPVDRRARRLVHPPLMPGWHDRELAAAFARFPGPFVVDNDVNVAAAGLLVHDGPGDLLVVKVGTGIGCGVVLDGRVYRGSTGSAGDIGHVQVPAEEHALCSCGGVNCLEALAGGAALVRQSQEAGLAVSTMHDLAALTRAGDPRALRLVRDAGRRIGEVLASLVTFYNPRRIVLVGSVTLTGDVLLAGVREVVYARSLPLAAAGLEIALADEPEQAGWLGAARLAVDAHLSDDSVASLLAEASPSLAGSPAAG